MSVITHFLENVSSGINRWAFSYYLRRAACLVRLILWGAGGGSLEGNGCTDSVAAVFSDDASTHLREPAILVLVYKGQWPHFESSEPLITYK